jgi:site-specific DNA recombinase
LEAGAKLIRAALDLLDDPQELYRQTTDPVRRQLNQVFFDKLYLDAHEVTNDVLSRPINDFHYSPGHNRGRVLHTRVHKIEAQNGAPWDAAGGISAGAVLLERVARGEGSSKGGNGGAKGTSLELRRAPNCPGRSGSDGRECRPCRFR